MFRGLTPTQFLIVCPLLFLAGFVDSIAGGGGLISLPAYLFAGLPIHNSIATNKLSSACGTTLATARFIRHKLVNVKVAVPSVAAGMAGSFLGARISFFIPEIVLKRMLLVVLPVTAFIVLNNRMFRDHPDVPVKADRRTLCTALAAAFVIGVYDGLYGPGTGTFLIIAFNVFAKMSVGRANAHCKVINASTNIAALGVYLTSGQVIVPLGIAAAICNMLGNYTGAGFALKKGTKITKPLILFVLVLLLIKIISEM